MKEKPILFSTEMVKAILEGRKTQTRRAIKYPKCYDLNLAIGWEVRAHRESPELFSLWYGSNYTLPAFRCPFGQPGDRLWVRETWFNDMSFGSPEYYYRANGEFDEQFERHRLGQVGPFKWRPSIFMPREACRILLEVTDVRVERLLDISEKDAEAEGVESSTHDGGQTLLYKINYLCLWDKINGKGSWEKNPWVWVVSFRRVEP